jgi:hypothetical protein
MVMRAKLSLLLVLSIGLVAALTWVGLSSAGVLAAKTDQSTSEPLFATRSPSSLVIASSSSCYTWDFLNNTGEDTTGLVAHLQNIASITQVYTGTFNVFGAPDPSSGYNPVTHVYSLIFKGATVNNGDLNRIGICTPSPSLHLDTIQPSFYWVVSGTVGSPAPLFAGLDYNWLNPNHLQIHLSNEQSITVTADSLSVLTPGNALTLDDLNDDVASLLPVASLPITSPLEMSGGSSLSFDINLTNGGVHLLKDQPIVLEAVLSDPNDPGNLIHLLVQTTQPFAEINLPLMNKSP